MQMVLALVGGAAGLAVGIVGGFKLGKRVRGRSRWCYWGLNLACVAIGMGLALLDFHFHASWLVTAAVGFLGGGLTGLKYGYGRSVGLWRVHDRALGVDEDLPRE